MGDLPDRHVGRRHPLVRVNRRPSLVATSDAGLQKSRNMEYGSEKIF